MKITELIKELEKAKNSVGDVEVCTDGYFGTLEIEELKITTWGEKGRYMGSAMTNQIRPFWLFFFRQICLDC